MKFYKVPEQDLATIVELLKRSNTPLNYEQLSNALQRLVQSEVIEEEEKTAKEKKK